MEIGKKLKQLREAKKFSQGVIEKRTGLLRCYISRVENGHTVPSYETLVKLARALEVPTYRLFTDEEHVKMPKLPSVPNDGWGRNIKQSKELRAFGRALSKLDERSHKLLMTLAQQMEQPKLSAVRHRIGNSCLRFRLRKPPLS